MTTNNLKSSQPRVLVVENDPRWRKVHFINLTRWGYRPVLAEGQGQALLQDARDRAKTYRCHVALVDMRLLDHYDSSDCSGLHLVPELTPTRSIIVSASSREDLEQKALQEKGADGFINKREGPKVLEKALESSLQRSCAASSGIHFQWLDGLSDGMIISSLFGANCGLPADQVHDLLALLFPNAKRLRLERFTGHASAQHVVPLKVYVDYDPLASHSPQAQVVEIGKKEDIQSQQPPNQPIGRDNYAYLWDLGAKIEGTPRSA